MLGKLKEIYKLVPGSVSLPFLRMTGLSPIFSKKHWKKVRNLDEEIANTDVDSQLRLLSVLMRDATVYSTPPYNEFRTLPTLENFKKIPFIDSTTVRGDLDSFINNRVAGYYTTTGGSGRNPLKVFLSNRSYFIDRIHVFHAWSTLGYNRGDLKLTLRGVNLGKMLFRFNPMNNELLINVFLLNIENLPDILEVINKYKPTFGHGYPSAWYNFASLLRESNFSFNHQLKGIYFASETIDSLKRDLVESVFGIPVRATYGFTERAGFAFELPDKKSFYKVPHTYGLVEIVKEDGTDAEVGERGEIVCTGFINAGMPLIRYKPGDSAVVGKMDKGIVTEIKDIEGRWGKDFIIDSKGTEIYTTSINVHTPAQFDFRYIQLVQRMPGELLIKLVPFSTINPRSLEAVKTEFQEKMPFVVLTTEEVTLDKLYVTERGKVPFLVKDL